jgi:cold shock CspA family protein
MTQAAEQTMPVSATEKRMSGTVIRISGPDIPKDQRYGFIRDSNGKDWFFHSNHIDGPEPREGAFVSFVPVILNRPGKADRAMSVRLARPAK